MRANLHESLNVVMLGTNILTLVIMRLSLEKLNHYPKDTQIINSHQNSYLSQLRLLHAPSHQCWFISCLGSLSIQSYRSRLCCSHFRTLHQEGTKGKAVHTKVSTLLLSLSKCSKLREAALIDPWKGWMRAVPEEVRTPAVSAQWLPPKVVPFFQVMNKLWRWNFSAYTETLL